VQLASIHVVRLGKARLGSGDITPLLDHWLLDLPWVGAGPGADLLGDVNALLSGLEQGHQLGDVLALLLGLQVAGLLWHLGDNSLSLREALLWAGHQITAGGAAKLFGNLLTLSLGRVLLDVLLVGFTDLLGPLGTLLLGGVTLGHILALFFLDGLTLNDIILNIMLVVPGLTLGFVDRPAFHWALTVTNKWGVAELNFLLRGYLSVVNETVLDEVLLTLLLLLWLKVSGVGCVALLAVTVFALDDIIVLSLFYHDHLVDTSLASSSNGPNVKVNITSALTRSTGIDSLVSMGMLMVMVMSGMLCSLAIALVEWESSPQILTSPVGSCC